MSKVRQKVQEMVGMTLQSAATERAETVSRSSPERRVRFSPDRAETRIWDQESTEKIWNSDGCR